MKTFGGRLRYLRVKQNLTQKQLGSSLKISESAIGMYERDEREPSFELVARVADYFDVSVDWLLVRTNNPSTKIDFNLDINDPELGQWFLELSDESREEAKRFIKFLAEEERSRKPGDKQGE